MSTEITIVMPRDVIVAAARENLSNPTFANPEDQAKLNAIIDGSDPVGSDAKPATFLTGELPEPGANSPQAVVDFWLMFYTSNGDPNQASYAK